MSHIDGQIGTIDLEDPQPSDYFKIGVAHAEQKVPQNPTYSLQPAYLEGYAFGLAMNPYLFARRDGYLDRYLTYETLRNRYLTYQEIADKFTYDKLLLPQ